MYVYFTLRSGIKYSGFLTVNDLCIVLDGFPELSGIDNRHYQNADGFPWATVSIINCDANGNYPAGLDQNSGQANLVELICGENDRKKIAALAQKISESLKWEMVES